MQSTLLDSAGDEAPKPNVYSLLNEGATNEELASEKREWNDNELFIRQAFLENPSKGCALLFRRYHKMLCSHAVRFVYSKDIAEDLVSDVFCRFWKTKAYETVTSSYRLYLFRSVRNEALNYLRWEFKETENIELAEYRESPRSQQPDHATQYEEVVKKVEDLVNTLPPQCQKVFLMSRFEGKKYQEIADEMAISLKTVEAHLGKALSIMRNGLKNHL
ncbi:RNA polymerase sigma-70 factor [Runella limosa]|jgi:RNA polymerase sigma-70 factor (ECF subfamily)|uniref:RNA polymerase sigma-70 factor n=1 Tax=Runella limosa TaxID=370978 RepID=UPI000402F4CD|nr:RNA polymerase sigma-70 factor [Runella limosa]